MNTIRYRSNLPLGNSVLFRYRFVMKSHDGLFYAAVFVCSTVLSCSAPQPQTFTAIGTVCTVNLFDGGTRERYEHIREILADAERVFSANTDDSQLAAINRNAGISPAPANSSLITVTAAALDICRRTGGAFNPAIGAVVKLWNIGFDNAAVPDETALKNACAAVCADDIEIDAQNGTIMLLHRGMQLDLGGIAKGAAADSIAAYLISEHIQKAIVDLGGNILLFGSKEDGELWNVGIKNPEQPESPPLISMKVPAVSVVTSGIYERFFTSDDGTVYHHILDPYTGYPVINNLLSVSVISQSSTMADGLSTAAFVLGLERGRAFIESCPGIDALFITKDRKIYATSGIEPRIQVRDSSYVLVH